MEKEFVPYELALKLKELGFDGKCLGYYKINDRKLEIEGEISDDVVEVNKKHLFKAPLWQQAFDWFENNLIYSHIKTEGLGSDEWEFVYGIKYLPKEFQDYKKRGMHFKTIESISFGMGTYDGAWSDKNECRYNLLKKLIEIFEQNK